MSNKRAIARQLKQKKKQQKQLTIAICCAAALVIAGIFGAWGYGVYSLSYIMDYEGEKVDMSYFMFSVLASDDGSGDAAAVKDSAVNLLVEHLTLEKHARDDGIVLTDEEKDQALQTAQTMKSVYSQIGYDFSSIPDENVGRLMTRETLYSHLLEKHTADFTADEADFQTQLAEYKENQKADYYNIGLKFISADSAEAMDAAVAALTDSNFDEVVAEHSTSYTEESGVLTEQLKNMYTALPAETTEAIINMPVGGRTEPVELSSGTFYLFEKVSHEVPPDAEVEATFREQYTAVKKDEMFQTILNGWITDAQSSYSLNQRAYDSL